MLIDVDEPRLAARALERARPLLGEDSPLAGSFLNLSDVVLAALDKDEMAEESLRLALQAEPDDLRFAKDLITFLVERSRFSEAGAAAAEALERHPTEPWLRNVREGLEEYLG